jgi:hypothetical protein
MMMLLLLFALAPLLFCNAALVMVFHHWRRYPILQKAINLKRPCWLALFTSLGIGAVCLAGAFGFNRLSENFHPNKPGFGGPYDVVIVLCCVLAGAAIISSVLSAVWCLFRLISALISHVYSLQSKQS